MTFQLRSYSVYRTVIGLSLQVPFTFKYLSLSICLNLKVPLYLATTGTTLSAAGDSACAANFALSEHEKKCDKQVPSRTPFCVDGADWTPMVSENVDYVSKAPIVSRPKLPVHLIEDGGFELMDKTFGPLSPTDPSSRFLRTWRQEASTPTFDGLHQHSNRPRKTYADMIPSTITSNDSEEMCARGHKRAEISSNMAEEPVVVESKDDSSCEQEVWQHPCLDDKELRDFMSNPMAQGTWTHDMMLDVDLPNKRREGR
ncbi:unnamed protein product [Protopolystoma xenopodis]|uniref:Uncharacterized protein n=1 Tax=Protopolystoma xenopodis TaxID=117903 RepID=A0A3S5B9P2_9PLAT|nr:unnamed protein product [Protopolystoma xenopodis]